jgi:hypothetical protein
MNLTALLSFYDERPEWLERMILSLRLLPVTRLVAVDGAYELYPNGKGASSTPTSSSPAHRTTSQTASSRPCSTSVRSR